MQIPVVFSFDAKFLLPAAVAISSLLANAGKEEMYTIICLYNGVAEKDLNWLLKLRDKYGNCKFRFEDMNRSMQDTFADAHTTDGHITRTAYIRLLIPRLFPEYDKIIYADVDMIFRRGFSGIWQNDIGNSYIGAVRDYGISRNSEFMNTIGMTVHDYINSGFLIMNNRKLIEDNMVSRWLADIHNPVNSFYDQDIINKTCQGHVQLIPAVYNYATEGFCNIVPYDVCVGSCMAPSHLSVSDWKEARKEWNIHYTGRKPWWKGPFICYPMQKIWWRYYFRLPSGAPKQLFPLTILFLQRHLLTLQLLAGKKIRALIPKRVKRVLKRL